MRDRYLNLVRFDWLFSDRQVGGLTMIHLQPERPLHWQSDRRLESESMRRQHDFAPWRGQELPDRQDNVDVLRTLDFDVLPGDVLVIRGPSGSGKSTLLNIVGLLDEPSAASFCWKASR